uniref:G_PROTEIN_RECEP_F1_2 domain-containing protein n=1 Tax=Brugia timori TaxID=42155 RepID=A0A0R3RAF3_9BILA
LVGKEVEISVNILINCFVIFNAAVLPTANLIFVKRFRERVKKTFIELLFKIKAAQSRSTVVPITSITSRIDNRSLAGILYLISRKPSCRFFSPESVKIF